MCICFRVIGRDMRYLATSRTGRGLSCPSKRNNTLVVSRLFFVRKSKGCSNEQYNFFLRAVAPPPPRMLLFVSLCHPRYRCWVPMLVLPGCSLPAALGLNLRAARATQGSILGLLTRTPLSAWSLSPLKVVLRRERTLPVPHDRTHHDRRSGGNSRRRSSSARKRSSKRTGGSSSSSRRRRRGMGKASSRRGGQEEQDEAENAEAAPEESHRQVCVCVDGRDFR